jgi:hypothetical protein
MLTWTTVHWHLKEFLSSLTNIQLWSSIVILGRISAKLSTNEYILPDSIFQSLHFLVLYLHTAALALFHPIYSETHELNLQQKKFLTGISFFLGYDVPSLDRPLNMNDMVRILFWLVQFYVCDSVNANKYKNKYREPNLQSRGVISQKNGNLAYT